MNRLHAELLAVIFLLSLMFFLASYSDFVTEGKAISQSQGLPEWATWAGAPWDVTNPADTLVSTSLRDGKVIIAAKGHWIWRTGWIWNPSKVNADGSKGGWQSFEFPQTSQYDGWASETAVAEMSLQSDEVLNGDNYVLAYTCNWKNGRWYCGCRSENECGKWQLQTFTARGMTDAIREDMSKYLQNPSSVPNFEEIAQSVIIATDEMAIDARADFDADGTVDFDDFFVFAAAFRIQAYDAKFDLSGNGKVDFDDFFRFADEFGKRVNNVGENCKEVFPGFNGPVDERINLVFLSGLYTDKEDFLGKVRYLANINDETNSFFGFEPVKSNKNKFNLWYVDKNFDADYPLLYQYECDIPDNLKVKVVIYNRYFQSFANSAIKTVSLANVADPATLFHEFLHAFAELADEFDGPLAAITTTFSNCDTANTQTACSKWCKGAPVPVDSYKNEDCSQYDINTCANKMVAGSPCFAVFGNGRLGNDRSCINIISFCSSITDKDTCLDTKNNFYMDPQCSWVEEGVHPYFQTRCIPAWNRINVGTQCAVGTGCYHGCTNRGIFRSEKDGMLSTIGNPLGEYNEKILCDRIKEETTSAGGKCIQLFEMFK